MSRSILAASVWAFLFLVVAALARFAACPCVAPLAVIPDAPLARPDPAPVAPAARVTVPPAPPARTPTPTAAQSARPEPMPGARPEAKTPPLADSLATKPGAAPTPAPPAAISAQRPPRPEPRQEGATESGIPGLGSLPPGPGPEYQGLGVQVISRATGQPIQGARVRYALESHLAEWQRAHPETPVELADPEMVLQLCTTPVQSKVMGVALAESAPGRMLVDASFGREYGFAWVDRNKFARARIEIVEDRALNVRVKDEQGLPVAGAAVVVRDAGCAELWRGTSGADGAVAWRHASFLIERDAGPGSCTVQLDGVDTGPVVHPIARPFTDPRELVLVRPAAGRLRVAVTDPNGRAVTEPLAVTLNAESSSACAGFARRALVNGVAEFDLVRPGIVIEVSVDGGTVYESSSLRDRGPAAAGETREVRIATGRALPRFRARLVDAGKNPLARVAGTVWLECVAGGQVISLPAAEGFESDEDGRARFVMPHTPAGSVARGLLVVARNEFGDWCNAARIDLAAPPASGEHDLGERVLTEMPTLAAGYVLSDKDWPVPDAIVEVSSTDDPDLDPEAFTADPRFSTTADQMGRFRLRGLVEGARIALTASAPEHVRPPRRVYPRGERKIALAITRCASLSGSLLLPTGISFDRVHVRVDTADESIPAAVDSFLKWRCPGLPPGTVAVRATIDGIEGNVWSLPAVTLQPGIAVAEASTTIDLRALVSRFVVRALDAAGRPVGAGTAIVTEAREEGPFVRELRFENGLIEILARRPSVDVEIRAEGFEPVLLAELDRSQDVRLAALKGN